MSDPRWLDYRQKLGWWVNSALHDFRVGDKSSDQLKTELVEMVLGWLTETFLAGYAAGKREREGKYVVKVGEDGHARVVKQ